MTDYNNENNFGYDHTNYSGTPMGDGSKAPETGEYRYTSGSIHQDGAEEAPRYSYKDILRDAASGQTQQTSASEIPSPGRKQQKTGRKGRIALVLAAVMVFSVLCGAGGAVLASKLGLTGSSTVLYQSAGGGVTAENTSVGVSGIVSHIEDSVVAITTEGVSTNPFYQQYVTQGAGSGVVLSADGYIVTNYHVISGANTVTVTLNDGTTYDATVVGYDEANDIAVVKVNATGLTPAVLGDSTALAVGDYVLAIGNPLGTLSGTVTDGIISALSRSITIDGNSMTLLQTSAAVNPGNSGGGLFNAAGELIGIVNAKSSSDSSGNSIDNIGFAIPINSVKAIIDDLITKGYVSGRIVLGVSLIEISDSRTAAYYGLDETGVYLQSVETGSLADLGGMKAGDRVVSFHGVKIGSNSDLTDALAACSVGDRVEVKVSRSGKEYTLSLTLTEYIPSAAK